MNTISAAELEVHTLRPQEARALRRQSRYHVNLAIAGQSMRVCFDDESATQAFAGRYRDHRSDAAGVFEYYVAKSNGMYLFFSHNSPVWSWRHGTLPPDAIAFLADAAAISGFVRSTPALASFHAAALSNNNVAFAVLGDSTAGKTTTAVACARRGMRFYSDERLLVNDYEVMPFLRSLNIRSGGLAGLAADPLADRLAESMAIRARAGCDWENVSVTELFGLQAVAQPAPLRVVFLLSDFCEAASAHEVGAYEALPAMVRWLDCRQTGWEAIDRVRRLLARTKCYRLHPGTPDQTAQEIARVTAAIV